MDKKALSERDICTKFITPALKRAGWDDMTQIREEVSFTKGRIIVRGKLVSRGKAKRADYILYGELNVEWAFLLLTTLDFTRYQPGTAVPALQQGVLERIPVGLPPLAEQHRIVAKVDALIALCDRLEVSLTAAATRSRLLDALLAAALAPVHALGMKAAE